MSGERFSAQEVDVKAERRKRRFKAVVVILAGVVMLAGGAGVAWYLTPPPMPKTLEEAQALAHSARFNRLSDEKKQPYLDRIREQFGSLNRDERRALIREDEQLRNLMRSAWFQMFEQRAREFGLANPEQREQMLEQFTGMRPRRNDGERRPQGGRDPGAMRNRMSDRLANGNPQVTAYIGEMVQARRKQRNGR